LPAQQKLFEGPSLEALLDQINQQLGPKARIVRAEKTRQGGVLGFFAREEYRLTVQAPPRRGAPSARPDTSARTAASSSGGNRTSRAQSRTGREQHVLCAPPRATAPRRRPPAPAPPVDVHDDPFASLAAATTDVVDLAASPLPPPTSGAAPGADQRCVIPVADVDADDTSAGATLAGATIDGDDTPTAGVVAAGTVDPELLVNTTDVQLRPPGHVAALADAIVDAVEAIDAVVDGQPMTPTQAPPRRHAVDTARATLAPDHPHPAAARRTGRAAAGPGTVAFAGSFDEVLRRVAVALDDDPYPTDATDPDVDLGTDCAIDPGDVGARGADCGVEVPLLGTPGPAGRQERPSRAGPSDTSSQPGAPAATLRPAPGGTVLVHPVPSPSLVEPTGLSSHVELLADRLLAAGLPARDTARVVDAVAGGRRFADILVDLFCRLPAPPPLPDAPGTVVAVTGPASVARGTAALVAGEVGVDPTTVVVVRLPSDHRGGPSRPGSDRRATSTLELGVGGGRPSTAPAARRVGAVPAPLHSAPPALAAVEERRSAGGCQVVLVESPLGGPGRTWAAQVLAQLRPTALVGAVDALVKPEDVAAWVTALGGVDALAVDNLAATVSPAAILRTGVPVAWVDGVVATPERWAAAVGALVAA
jgi:hypothetical protein